MPFEITKGKSYETRFSFPRYISLSTGSNIENNNLPISRIACKHKIYLHKRVLVNPGTAFKFIKGVPKIRVH